MILNQYIADTDIENLLKIAEFLKVIDDSQKDEFITMLQAMTYREIEIRKELNSIRNKSNSYRNNEVSGTKTDIKNH